MKQETQMSSDRNTINLKLNRISIGRNAILEFLNRQPIWKSYMGKRSDDIGYNKLAKNNPSAKLNTEEKNKIKNVWGTVIPTPLRIGYSYYEIIKSIRDFSPYYLPSAYYMPYVFDRLNMPTLLSQLTHKSLHKFFFREIAQPKTIICSISGLFFDDEYRLCSREEALHLLLSTNKELIYKPATGSSMGRGIKLITSESPGLESFLDSKIDFIIQERASQSEFMSYLNGTSLNCMRLTSININGYSSVTNMTVKLGAKGSIVDNIGSGAGGTIIGVSKDGTLAANGFKVDGSIVKEHNGIIFGGLKIPCFETVLSKVEQLHTRIPSMGIIGWDIALSSDNTPLLVEANIFWPGITLEQMANGPIFAERTEEVLEYLKLS